MRQLQLFKYIPKGPTWAEIKQEALRLASTPPQQVKAIRAQMRPVVQTEKQNV